MFSILFLVLISSYSNYSSVKFLKYDLLDENCRFIGVTSIIPLYNNNGSSKYELCTDYHNEILRNDIIKFNYDDENPDEVLIEEFGVETTRIENCSFLKYSFSKPKFLKYKLGECVSVFLDEELKVLRANLTVLSKYSYVHLTNQKEVLQRKGYSVNDRNCSSEVTTNYFLMKNEIRSLGYTLHCNETHYTTSRNVTNPFNKNQNQVHFIERIEKIGVHRCKKRRWNIDNGLPGQIYQGWYENFCVSHSVLERLEKESMASVQSCPIFSFDVYSDETCGSTEYLQLLFKCDECLPQTCDITKCYSNSGQHICESKEYYLCAEKVYVVGGFFVTFFYDNKKCDSESNFVSVKKSYCEKSNFIVGVSQDYSCFPLQDNKYPIRKQGSVAISFSKSNNFLGMLEDVFVHKSFSLMAQLWKRGKPCFTKSLAEIFILSQNLSFIGSCDESSNDVTIYEYNDEICLPPETRVETGRYIMKKNGDPMESVLGNDILWIFCTPFFCFDKSQYDPNVCSKKGECESWDSCSCTHKLWYTGEDCSFPLWIILLLLTIFSVLFFFLSLLFCCFLCISCFVVSLSFTLLCSSFLRGHKRKKMGETLSEKTPLLEPYYYNPGVQDEKMEFRGEENGTGQIINKDGQIIFEGTFKDGKKNGKGKEFSYILVDDSADVFFEDDRLHKQPNHHISDTVVGRKMRMKRKRLKAVVSFEGIYRNGKKHGKGIEYHSSNRYGDMMEKICGEWRFDKIVSIEFDEVDLPLIKISDFQIDFVKNKIGSGSEGDVFKVEYEGREVALKIMRFEEQDDAHGINRFLLYKRLYRSQKIWSKVSNLDYPFILKLLGWTGISEDSSCNETNQPQPQQLKGYITELCEMSLSQAINRRNILSKPSEKSRVLYEVAMGMQFLHNQSIMHRDLKTSNILLAHNGTVKICDFEFSRYDEMDWKSIGNVSSFIGTPCSIAPEVMKNKGYTKKCDVYSFGILVFCVVYDVVNPYSHMDCCSKCGEDLKSGRKLIHQHVCECGLRPSIISRIIDEENNKYEDEGTLKWLIDQIMIPCVFTKLPQDRPSFDDIVRIFQKENPMIKNSESNGEVLREGISGRDLNNLEEIEVIETERQSLVNSHRQTSIN